MYTFRSIHKLLYQEMVLLPLTITFSGSSTDLSICPNTTVSVGPFLIVTQCAAVSTSFELISTPPHTKDELILSSTCQGYCPLLAGSQPIHLALVIVVEKLAHCWSRNGGGGDGGIEGVVELLLVAGLIVVVLVVVVIFVSDMIFSIQLENLATFV